MHGCRKSGRKSCTLPLYAMEEQSADLLQHARFHLQSLWSLPDILRSMLTPNCVRSGLLRLDANARQLGLQRW